MIMMPTMSSNESHNHVLLITFLVDDDEFFLNLFNALILNYRLVVAARLAVSSDQARLQARFVDFMSVVCGLERLDIVGNRNGTLPNGISSRSEFTAAAILLHQSHTIWLEFTQSIRMPSIAHRPRWSFALGHPTNASQKNVWFFNFYSFSLSFFHRPFFSWFFL